MKLKALIILAIVFFLAADVQAQEKSTQTTQIPGIPSNIPRYQPPPFYTFKLGAVSPNELKSFEFFRNGRLKDLLLGISTKEDVAKIFGSACEKTCRYDKDWSISFIYFDEKVILTESFARDGKIVTRDLVILPEYRGRIRSIRMVNRKRIPSGSVVVPRNFYSYPDSRITFNRNKSKTVTTSLCYADSYGLIYEFFEKTSARKSKKSQPGKGDLTSVQYKIPADIQEKMYIEQKSDNK